MERQKILQQMIDLIKIFFDSWFSMMAMFQHQTEEILKPFVDCMPGMDGRMKKFIRHWSEECKKNRETFKRDIDAGYAKAEAFFDYHAILKFQEQNEQLLNDFLSQTTWMPDDFKTAAEKMADVYKDGCDKFRRYVEKNINGVSDFSSSSGKPGRKAGSRKK